MSIHSDNKLLILHEIKSKIESIKDLTGTSYVSMLNYIKRSGVIGEHFIENKIDELVELYGIEAVTSYLDESIRLAKKAESASFEAHSQTLYTGERKRRVNDDNCPESAWGHYYDFLTRSGFTNIFEIKASSLNILEMMRQDVPPDHPVRGAVIGNVQSGKTANMEALISLAADNGWNFFVILTGLTTNLMEQTRNRMLGDLRRDPSNPEDPLIYNWVLLDPLVKGKDFLKKYDINFGQHNLYMYHAQKNKIHLKNIIECLDKIPQKEKINLLVIDDESDQASVDSSGKDKILRSTINQLIINLVYNRLFSSKENDVKCCKNRFGSVNYIGYTATPYANLLNEPTGLYPEHFITSLTPPSLYMGLKQFYGDGEEEGLGEHVTVIDDSIGKIIKKRSSSPIILPESLKDSIAWFYCCVAVLKLRRFGKPVSMLINVDVRVEKQLLMNQAVMDYILNQRDDLFKRCEDVYSYQTGKLTLNDFKEILPDYGGNVDEIDISDYPEFSEIVPFISSLIGNGLTHISIDENKNYVYSPNTVHDCVDNGSDDPIPLGETGKNCTNRIVYPSKTENAAILEETPAFLVLGGQTLSRGLTIEGLVSTYFIRKTATADTCLQMARWFGFRKGYELLPRIWMDSATYKAFCALAVINESLFVEIRKYKMDGTDPKDYYAKIRDVPAACMLKSLTARNKSKASGKTYRNGGYRAKDKYPTKFFNDRETLEYNVGLTEKLVEGHDGQPSPRGSSYVFRNVPFSEVLEYLSALRRPVEDSTINSFDPFLDWLKKYDPETLTDCNIVLYGTENESKDLVEPTRTFAGKYRINKVQRSRKSDNIGKDVICFKTVRDKKSLLMDLDLDECKRILESEPGAFEKLLKGDPTIRCQARRSMNLEKTATLSITTIGVDDKQNNGFEYDIIAPSIFVPGDVESEFDFEKSPYVQMMEIRDDS